jgi:hypothetical protein
MPEATVKDMGMLATFDSAALVSARHPELAVLQLTGVLSYRRWAPQLLRELLSG